MRIISTNIENLAESKKAIYMLTKAPGVNVKDFRMDESVEVNTFALYTETKTGKDGSESEQEVLAIILADGTKLATISPTFIRSFMEIVEMMDGDPFAIICRKSVSKGGREFVTCELDCA